MRITLVAMLLLAVACGPQGPEEFHEATAVPETGPSQLITHSTRPPPGYPTNPPKPPPGYPVDAGQ